MPNTERRATSSATPPIPTPRADAERIDEPPGPPSPPHQWIAEVLRAMGCRRAGRKWQCPAHGATGSHTASLVVGPRADGDGAWIYCHAGCTLVALLRALGLRPSHLQDPPGISPTRYVAVRRLRREWPPLRSTGHGRGDGFRHEAWHLYGPDRAKERLRRADGAKLLRWESRNAHGEWVPGLLGARESDLPLYREDEVRMAAAAGEVVVLCESESSCDALRGVYATTWAGGSANPPGAVLAAVLGAADVVVIPDHDTAGLACLARLLETLPHARVLIGEPGEDARDLYTRLGAAAFAARLDTATTHRPATGAT